MFFYVFFLEACSVTSGCDYKKYLKSSSSFLLFLIKVIFSQFQVKLDLDHIINVLICADYVCIEQ